MKLIRPTTFILVTIAACATIVLEIALGPTSTSAFVSFAVWLISPYAIMGAALIWLHSRGKATLYWCVVATVVSAGGILFLVDVIFWHPDAQGAIAVLMTPLLQAVALVLSVAAWLSRNMRIRQ
jgi:hypothetical protein